MCHLFYYICLLYRFTLTLLLYFFFFQAEDGIRDLLVTGVQTCGSSDLCASRHAVSRSAKPLAGRNLFGRGLVALPERHYCRGHRPRCPVAARHLHAEPPRLPPRSPTGCTETVTSIIFIPLALTFPIHDSSPIICFSPLAAVTGEAVRHPTGPVRAVPLLVQSLHDRRIPEHGPGRHPDAEFMTDGAGTGAGRAKDEFAMRVHSRLIGNLSQGAAMLRMAGRAGRPLRNHLTMPRHDSRRGTALKITFGVAAHTTRRTRSEERRVTMGAAGDIHKTLLHRQSRLFL